VLCYRSTVSCDWSKQSVYQGVWLVRPAPVTSRHPRSGDKTPLSPEVLGAGPVLVSRRHVQPVLPSSAVTRVFGGASIRDEEPEPPPGLPSSALTRGFVPVPLLNFDIFPGQSAAKNQKWDRLVPSGTGFF